LNLGPYPPRLLKSSLSAATKGDIVMGYRRNF
jgi:hypothetical protein